MKNILLIASILVGSVCCAQSPQGDNFNQAKLHLANHKLNQAIPILESLWKNDPSNANLNYLLGLCYVKEDVNTEKSVELLEAASKIYATNYEAGSNRERRAPEYVYYYLTIAYSKNGMCEEALRALNNFYQVYTYNDEYYLVDGQKWVRECNLGKKEEEPDEPEEPAVAQRVEDDKSEEVEVVAETADPFAEEEEPEMTEEQIAGQEILAEVIQEKTEPQIKERLIPFDDWDNLRTREVNYTSLNSQYGVQVAALIDLKPTREFTDLKNVEVYVDENGIFRYVVGRFPYRKQAESLREKIKEIGYGDAFIVDIKTPLYDTEVLGIGASNIDWRINGSVDFRVQVGAFTTLVTSVVAMKYLEIEGIKEYQQNGLTILTVGNLDTYEQAVAFRDELVAKGIEDAFVVAFNMGNKISLKEAMEYVESQPKEAEPKPPVKRRKADF